MLQAPKSIVYKEIVSMTRTFMEDPVWILVVGLLITAVLGFVWTRVQKFGWLAACIAVLLLTIGLVALERFIKTDREKLRYAVSEIARAVEDNDLEKLITFTSPAYPECEKQIRKELPSYTFERCNVIQHNVLVFDDPKQRQRAMVVFLVVADVSAPRYSYKGFVNRRVALFFEKQSDGSWLMYDYDHEDPKLPFAYLPQDDNPPRFMDGPGKFSRSQTRTRRQPF